jgi:hypothetical protein
MRQSGAAQDFMALKPQDVYEVLKLVADGSRRASYSHLALELVMSPSEVHASVKRARASGLLHGQICKIVQT